MKIDVIAVKGKGNIEKNFDICINKTLKKGQESERKSQFLMRDITDT